ncbi:MAG TPA: hypothetical protein VJT74_07120 [Pyrinomonadaceae bacterium]|nr:hypothetical protein [Pyrinomonadaceae bacterium]
MNDAPRQTLRELVARHGPDLCSDARRCEGLLRDLCGEHRREINLLVSALEERVPLDLLAARGSVPHGLLLTRLSKRLEDQLAVTEQAARWAVESWALALGVVTDAEVEERERELAAEKKSPASQPPAAHPAPQAQRQQQGRPPAPARPPARQTGKPLPQPPPTPTAPARPPMAPVQNPFSWPRQHAPEPFAADPAFTQAPPERWRPRGIWWSFRGCLLGFFLLALLTFALFVGVPYVLSVLREEQQQRSVEPGPIRPR